MPKVSCKTCKWWEEWLLPEGKTLQGMGKARSKHAKAGECRNDRTKHSTTFSADSCEMAELREGTKNAKG